MRSSRSLVENQAEISLTASNQPEVRSGDNLTRDTIVIWNLTLHRYSRNYEFRRRIYFDRKKPLPKRP